MEPDDRDVLLAVERDVLLAVERDVLLAVERVVIELPTFAVERVAFVVLPVERVAVAVFVERVAVAVFVERVAEVLAVARVAVERVVVFEARVAVFEPRVTVEDPAVLRATLLAERVISLAATVRVLRTLLVARISRALVMFVFRRVND